MFKIESKGISQKELDKMITSAARLKKISADEFSGWAEFVRLLEGYCQKLLDYKKNFNMSMASDEQIEMLKLHDRDVWLIQNFIKKIPANFCDGLEAEIRRQNEETVKEVI